LRRIAGPLLFVLPEVPRAELARRLEERPQSFMPPSLLGSQLATLERPDDDEAAMCIDGTRPVAGEIQRVREYLDASDTKA
jgi:gluconokinase